MKKKQEEIGRFKHRVAMWVLFVKLADVAHITAHHYNVHAITPPP